MAAYERYINGKTWEQVAVQMNYSYVHIVHRMHPAVLRTLQEVLTQNDRKRKAPSQIAF